MIKKIIYDTYINVFPFKKPRKCIEYTKKHYGNKLLKGCEVGVREGSHTKSILYNLNIKVLFGIDIDISQGIIKDKRLVLMKGDSLKCIPKLPLLNFVYIDGCHTYNHVKKEIELLKPKIVKGGFIGGHDFNRGTGVPQAVLESFKLEKINFKDNDWWVQV